MVTALLLTVSMFLLAGCGWFDPPREVTTEAQELAAQIREINDVTAVEVDVYGRDFIDHPED
jgi:outer membrane murein-binding lipoprotein Lpp